MASRSLNKRSLQIPSKGRGQEITSRRPAGGVSSKANVSPKVSADFAPVKSEKKFFKKKGSSK